MRDKRDGQLGAGLESGTYQKESAKGKGEFKPGNYDAQSARLGAGKRAKAVGDGKHKYR